MGDIKYFSRENIIELLTSLFPNKKTVDKLGESTSGTLLFNGNEIKGGGGNTNISKDINNAIQEKQDGLYVEDLSPHIIKTILSSDGVHGLRYYNSKLQYLDNNNSWVTVSGLGDITICPETMGKINQLGDSKEIIKFIKC